MQRKLSLLIIVCASLFFANCFQILNYIQFNGDGSLNVVWRFTISKSLAERPASEEEQGDDFQTKMEEARQKVLANLGNKVKDLKAEVVDTEYDTGMIIAFKVPDRTKMPALEGGTGDDELPAFPIYDAKTNTLKVTFESKEKKEVAEEATPGEPSAPSGEPGESSAEGQEMDEMGNKIAKMVLSSARYQILISGKVPAKATSIGTETKDVEILKLGDQYLIDYPFMSSLTDGSKKVDLVIQMKD
ncbi:MAG: hypothetical protein KDK37_06735 [Leptospiraceae bacterium]|nr:hypothetical protein [Leptospiraceae bacterium]